MVKTFALYPQVNFDGLNLKQQRDQSKIFALSRAKVLARDQQACRFCRFKDEPQFMQVVNLDGNYRNNKLTNLVTACVLCFRCLFVGVSFEEKVEGIDRIVYLPELSQNKLNQLVRVLIVAMDSATPLTDSARDLYSGLRHRRYYTEKIFGEQVSDARIFAQSILDANLQKHKNLNKVIRALRYIPARDSVQKHIPAWMDTVNSLVPADFSLD